MVCRGATPGKDNKGGIRDGVSESDSSFDRPLTFGREVRIPGISEPSRPFDPASHTVEDFNAAARMASNGGFPGYHQGVRLFVNSIRTVGDLGPCGSRIVDHGLKKVGGDNDSAPKLVTSFDDSPLDDGQFLDMHLDSQIPPGHHHEVRGLDDVIKVFDGFLVFQF